MITPVVDYYAILQVHERAEQEIVDFAYKKLSKMYHPDINRAPDACERMVAINQAYEILGDPALRAQYDRQKPHRGAAGRVTSGVRDDSAQVLAQYFSCIRDGMYRDAYHLLSRHDRQETVCAQFIDWRVSVDQYYRIHRFRIGASRYHPEYEMPGGTRLPARRFTVEIQEQNRQNGTVAEYALIKYMVQEDGRWRLHLGYSDLTSMTRGIEEHVDIRASTKPLTGMLGTAAFTHRLELECYRQKRYGRRFALGILPFMAEHLPRGDGEDYPGRLATLAGETVARMLRVTDAIGYFSAMRFAVLLDEASDEEALPILERLARTLIDCAERAHDARLRCAPILIRTRGQELGAVVRQCCEAVPERARRFRMG